MKKFELEEKSLKKDADLPGLVIMPTEMTLPEVDVETSAILPEKFWPADMTASQIDKFTIDQVHAIDKFFD